MSFRFPSAPARKLGYATDQVDDFIRQARIQFENQGQSLVTANSVRNVEFDLVRGGYLISAVDTAIDRLEDAFAGREIQSQKATRGDLAVSDRKNRIFEIVACRAQRPKRKRFANTGLLMRGYSRKQVDQLCLLIDAHLADRKPLGVNTVRRAIFKSKRAGYNESQVDAFIDRVVELLQLEQNI